MSYYRQSFSFGPPLRKVVKQLVIVTAAAFLVTYLPAQIFGWALPFALFGLRPYDVTHHLFIWQLATYLFLHGGWFHIIFNLFALWMFGTDLENLWGSRQFLFYYFLTGVGAGLLNVALEPSSIALTIGCSGAIYGLLLAFGLTFPERPIFLYFLIPIKAKWFVVIMGLIEFVSSLSTAGSGVSQSLILEACFSVSCTCAVEASPSVCRRATRTGAARDCVEGLKSTCASTNERMTPGAGSIDLAVASRLLCVLSTAYCFLYEGLLWPHPSRKSCKLRKQWCASSTPATWRACSLISIPA